MDDRVFERIVRQAVDGLPAKFKDALENIDIVIEDFPDPDEMDDMGIDEPLLGLYQGTPLTERGLGDSDLPDKISLYKGEFERMGIRGKELVEEIRITVLHEIGHYFGLEDDEMERMGY
jgi:predicted Zn-dependent protease with MMP-like domain